jgi:hypothetical protein
MDQAGELSRYLDRGQRRQIGAEVLARGLPVLPDGLTHQMSFPVACWTATRSAVVMFLAFREIEGEVLPVVITGTYVRAGQGWSASRTWAGAGWSHDPIGKPGSLRDLGGSAMVTSGGRFDPRPEPGYPVAVVRGRVAPGVTQIALIQDGREDRRPLESHFGAWVVCTEQPTDFEVTAMDDTGMVLGRIPYLGAAKMAERRRVRTQQRGV